jgi:hypothetical protein
VKLIVAALGGAIVALSLGLYGKVHDPSGEALFTLFFTSTINMKAWFASVALLLAGFQLFSALRMFGKIGKNKPLPSWLPTAHRISGIGAIAFSLPVAYHCLWSLGFQQLELRQVVHSLAGCFFYGAFVTKVFVLRSSRMPKWALPLAGGALFTALVVVWFTSAGWFFTEFGFPSI